MNIKNIKPEMKIALLFKVASVMIKKLRTENLQLKQAVGYLAKKEKAEKIAMDMVNKGLLPAEEYAKKVNDLIKESDLNSWEKAISLVKNSAFGDIGVAPFKVSDSDPLTAALLGED